MIARIRIVVLGTIYGDRARNGARQNAMRNPILAWQNVCKEGNNSFPE
jgi:hypothetical protein